MEETLNLETVTPLYGNIYNIVVNLVAQFSLDHLNDLKMEDHPVALGFINNIIKSALRKSSLVQIGRNPLFYEPKGNIIENVVETWPGFFTSAWIYQRGLYLIIDNITKFMSVETCLSMLNRRQEYGINKQAID
jgi:hypothetical protein